MPQAFYSTESRCDGIPEPDVSPPLKVGSNGGGQPPAVAFKPSHYTRGKDGRPSEVTPPLSADADKGDQDTVIATPFTKSKRAQSATDDESWVPGEVAPTFNCFDQGDTRATTVAIMPMAFDTYNQTLNQTLRAGGSEQAHEQIGAVWNGMAVRRLTTRECERLQGFPDDYTAITYRNKPAADGPRYKALGNSMAVPVMAWIGRRIAAASQK